MDIETFFMWSRKFVLPALCILCLFVTERVSAQNADSLEYVFHLGDFKRTVKFIPLHPESNQFKEYALQSAWNFGFFEASLDSIRLDDKRLNLWYQSGPRYSWTKPYWVGSNDSLNHYLKCETFESNPYFEYQKLVHCLQESTNKLMDDAYLDPRITIDSLDIDPESKGIKAFIHVHKGIQSKFDTIVFEGLTTVDSNWLKRVAEIDSNKVISTDVIRKSIYRIDKLQFFNPLDYPVIYRDKGRYVVKFSIDERPMSHFDIIAGYVPGTSGNSTFVGRGELKLRNVAFDGLDMLLQFDRMGERVGKLRFNINQNYLLGYPLGFTSSFSLIQQDTLWQSRNLSFTSWIELSDDVRIIAGLSTEASTLGMNIDSGMSDQKGRFGSVGFLFNNRQGGEESDPGLMLQITAETGTQRIQGIESKPGRVPRKRTSMDLETHIRIINRNNLVSGIHMGFLFKDDAQILDYWRLGGAQSIRGYREDQFFASNYIWTDLEYRFFLEQKSYLFSFAQLGRIQTGDTPITSTNKTIFSRSFGLGMAYSTNLGLLKFTYAKSPEDPFTNAKVHLGIQADF